MAIIIYFLSQNQYIKKKTITKEMSKENTRDTHTQTQTWFVSFMVMLFEIKI